MVMAWVAAIGVLTIAVCAWAGDQASLRGKSASPEAGNLTGKAESHAFASVDALGGALKDKFVLHKRFDLRKAPSVEFDVGTHPDQNLTHSCANYIDDGSTVFSRDGNLVLKVASHCTGGGCMNSGRIMSKESFKYGLFTFSAKVPKCNHIWPALWLLPEDMHGEGSYGRWPCSGEVDILETVHNQHFGTFNIVAGYGSTGGCWPAASADCNKCKPGYCTSTTMSPGREEDRYYVEEVDCNTAHPSWREHTFVLNWQEDELTTWIDPLLSYDAAGNLVSVEPRPSPKVAGGMQTWRIYRKPTTPTWRAVDSYMERCFPGQAGRDAPFDDGMKIVLNIAIGGYGGAPCMWGSNACQTICGGAVGSEMVVSDISVWQRML